MIDKQETASRLSRLGAALIDWLIYTIAFVAGLIVAYSLNVGFGPMPEAVETVLAVLANTIVIIEAILTIILLLLSEIGIDFFFLLPPSPYFETGTMVIMVFIGQMLLLRARGQTIGKMFVKVRVIDAQTGEHPSWIRLILLRTGVSLLILVPIVGWIFWLVDSLFIFRDDRRTIHDLIAKTRVDYCD